MLNLSPAIIATDETIATGLQPEHIASLAREFERLRTEDPECTLALAPEVLLAPIESLTLIGLLTLIALLSLFPLVATHPLPLAY